MTSELTTVTQIHVRMVALVKKMVHSTAAYVLMVTMATHVRIVLMSVRVIIHVRMGESV